MHRPAPGEPRGPPAAAVPELVSPAEQKARDSALEKSMDLVEKSMDRDAGDAEAAGAEELRAAALERSGRDPGWL